VDTLLHALEGSVDPWGYLIVFAVAAAEAALFLGIVVPGETILYFAGFLAWKGAGSIWVFMASAALGAAVGDSISYELGRRFGPALRASKVGRLLGEHRWQRAEQYLRRKGGPAVFLARWVTVAKSLVPALAGESRMPYRRFLLWNVIGALAWGSFHVGIAYVAGASYKRVEHYVGVGGAIALAVIVAAAVAVFLIHRHRKGESEGRRHEQGDERRGQHDGVAEADADAAGERAGARAITEPNR
jgi:membrane protein DedA with SNARE-associated domain